MTSFRFACPVCHQKVFNVIGEPKDLSALDRTTCSNCGHTVSQKEFSDWAVEIAIVQAKEGLKYLR